MIQSRWLWLPSQNSAANQKNWPAKRSVILRVQVGQKDFFQAGLEVSPRYLVGMEEIFRRYNLPTELTRIPFVESSFNQQATSKVGGKRRLAIYGQHGPEILDGQR